MSRPASPPARAEFVWMDGDFVPWADANVHVLSHVLHYGSSVFEGIRCYDTSGGSRVFRLQDHVKRLHYSARIMRMDLPYTAEVLADICVEAVRRNGFDACYIRPVVFRGAGSMGILPRDCPVHVVIAVWPWGAYLGRDALEAGIDVMTSSWRKMAPGTLPTMAKIGGGYALATLAKMEATRLGFAEALFLDTEGRVAEGTGENLFAVVGGSLLTPPVSSSILGGLTRDSIMKLAGEMGIPVTETALMRDVLYMADEIFLTGTAAEVTPIKTVDGLTVGPGGMGPVTRSLQKAFFDIVKGDLPDRHDWLTAVTPDPTGATRS